MGRTYTSFVVPKPGWYLVQCYGFVQSSHGHDAYLFAKVAGSTETISYGGESKTNIHKVPYNTFTGRITLDHPIAQSGNQDAMAIYSMFYHEEEDVNEGVATNVDLPLIMPLPDDTNVYDLRGRKVGTLGNTALPKGIYRRPHHSY